MLRRGCRTRCLIIDNYDSFTWILADYVAQAFGIEPLVIRNDQYSWREIIARESFDCIVISPGPGTATNHNDVHVSTDAIQQDDIPVLGICLGHQALAYFHGGEIKHAPVPFHGRVSTIHHDGSQLFKGLPPNFDAVRYHSLIVSPESLPEHFKITAQTECGLIMGLQHVRRPKWGLQFHPESILTSHGMQIISNFRDEVYRYAGEAVPSRDFMSISASGAAKPQLPGRGPSHQRHAITMRLAHSALAPDTVFRGLYSDADNCFWLDSQSLGQQATRFSFMGQGPALRLGAEDSVARYLTALEELLENTVVECDRELPFEFRGGYVGYLNYEMKVAFGAKTSHAANIPGAAWLHIDRFLAFDHQMGDVWLVAIAKPNESAGAHSWLQTTSETLKALRPAVRTPEAPGAQALSVAMDFGRAEYTAVIQRCKKKIADGESYQICLTNHFELELDLNPVDLYMVMRKSNPAPFGAFIRVGKQCILSTSPERLIKVEANGTVQTKPMKGTCARSDDLDIDRANAAHLAASEKERAENLMIVDLMRNDLARVSVPGSVRVSKLMQVESFQTVHQLVSTVESTAKPDCTLVDMIRAVFPAGSVTGAPKLRTMEIIDDLEQSPRGVYCGAIGYLGYNRVADLNVAIRTACYEGTMLKFGAGGAITYLSDPEDEFNEMLLKAEAVLRPIWQYVNGAEMPVEFSLRDRTLCLAEPASVT